MAEKRKGKKNYVVVFQDEYGNVKKTSFVAEGDMAIPPEMPVKKEETEHFEMIFAGWDKSTENVQDNLVIRAVYRQVPKKYLVIYFDEKDKILGMESVPYGHAAKAEYMPEEKSDEEFSYIFSGWNCSLEHITKDTSAKAVFKKKRHRFPVRFFHEDGSLLKEEWVVYGMQAHPPYDPVKTGDPVYDYKFIRWDKNFENVTRPMEVHPQFRPVYKEYRVSFYEEKKLLSSQLYHYGDDIVYPCPKKKGYDIKWSQTPERADKEYDIMLHWVFSNPAGKVISTENGEYEILNPSIKRGSVRLLRHIDENVRCLRVSQNVKLGDYYYIIEEIHGRAFAGCTRLERLYLPDSIRRVSAEAFADCRKLRSIHFGSGVQVLGARLFVRSVKLRELFLPGEALKKCDAHMAEGVAIPLLVRIKPEYVHKVKGKMLQGRKEGKIICAGGCEHKSNGEGV